VLALASSSFFLRGQQAQWSVSQQQELAPVRESAPLSPLESHFQLQERELEPFAACCLRQAARESIDTHTHTPSQESKSPALRSIPRSAACNRTLPHSGPIRMPLASLPSPRASAFPSAAAARSLVCSFRSSTRDVKPKHTHAGRLTTPTPTHTGDKPTNDNNPSPSDKHDEGRAAAAGRLRGRPGECPRLHSPRPLFFNPRPGRRRGHQGYVSKCLGNSRSRGPATGPFVRFQDEGIDHPPSPFWSASRLDHPHDCRRRPAQGLASHRPGRRGRRWRE
jgi:hypothetical protein